MARKKFPFRASYLAAPITRNANTSHFLFSISQRRGGTNKQLSLFFLVLARIIVLYPFLLVLRNGTLARMHISQTKQRGTAAEQRFSTSGCGRILSKFARHRDQLCTKGSDILARKSLFQHPSILTNSGSRQTVSLAKFQLFETKHFPLKSIQSCSSQPSSLPLQPWL